MMMMFEDLQPMIECFKYKTRIFSSFLQMPIGLSLYHEPVKHFLELLQRYRTQNHR